jgi:pimeloyl-ACP methyl ester carboxylesterase
VASLPGYGAAPTTEGIMEEFSSNGVRIAFIDEKPENDRGEPILLIHGFASTHAVNWLFPLWVRTLTGAGRRVIALDNRGHGRSQKLYDPKDYHTAIMADDSRNLLDHVGIERADVMGYSMGARIGAFLVLAHRARVRSLIMGGLGIHLTEGFGLPMSIAEAMEADTIEELRDPQQKMFRGFAEATKSDRRALAACIRGSRQILTPEEIHRIDVPTLVCVGTRDDVAGDPHPLAEMLPHGEAVDIPDRDHNRAVGDRVYKQAALEFLDERP